MIDEEKLLTLALLLVQLYRELKAELMKKPRRTRQCRKCKRRRGNR